MEGKTTRKTHQVLEGEDEGEEHGADGGVKKMGEQKWQFSYGERAVRRRAADGDDFDNDEIQEETDEDEYHDEDHDEEEEEEEEEESTALAQVYTTFLPSLTYSLTYLSHILSHIFPPLISLHFTCPPSIFDGGQANRQRPYLGFLKHSIKTY